MESFFGSILPVSPEGIFLDPARKIRKNRLRGGADREAYRNCQHRPSCFPGFEPPSPENPFRRWSKDWLLSKSLKPTSAANIIEWRSSIVRPAPVRRRGPGGGLGEGGSKAGYKCWFCGAVTKAFAGSTSPSRFLWFVSCAATRNEHIMKMNNHTGRIWNLPYEERGYGRRKTTEQKLT